MRRFIPFVLVGAGLAAYASGLGGPFIFDDLTSIPNNPTIRRLWHIAEVLAGPGDCAAAGRPIVNLSLALNYALGGLDVRGYHVFNLAVHIVAGLILWGIVRRTLRCPRLVSRYGGEACWLAMAVALIWILHPLQTESVTYVIQRTELLMGLSMLLTLYCVIRGLDAAHPRRWHGGAVLCCALGMASKEVMVVAPLVVLAYDLAFVSGSLREALRQRRGLYVGLAGTWLVLASLVAVTPRSAAGLGFARLTPWDYARTQCGVVVHYLRLAFWPHPLVLDYDDWPVARTLAGVAPAAAAVAALLGATLWAMRRRASAGFLGMAFFLILAPTSSLLPITTEIAAERRMYLPLAALVTLVVIGFRDALRVVLGKGRRWVELVALLVVATALGYGTVRRNADYRSRESVWEDVIAKRPHNARAHNNLANTLSAQGRKEAAIGHYLEALRIKPDYADAHNNLANALCAQGHEEAAIAHYVEALRINPNYADAHYNLATSLAQKGERREAIAHLEAAVRLNPSFQPARRTLERLRGTGAGRQLQSGGG